MKSTRRSWLVIGALAALAPWTTLAREAHAPAAHDAPAPSPPPGLTLKELIYGNGRFVEGRPAQKDLGSARRRELAGGQHPKAVVVSCSDSRVPPEHLFDQGLGDLFVVRLAGNVADPAAIGSVEYAAEHLGTRLVVVLGHRSCGAVKAALAGGEVGGNIGAIVKEIAPAVSAARKVASGHALEDAAILENARRSARALTERSPILRHLVAEGKVRIAVAIYDLATGRVEFGPDGSTAPSGHAVAAEGHGAEARAH